jgi:hypothetical protein
MVVVRRDVRDRLPDTLMRPGIVEVEHVSLDDAFQLLLAEEEHIVEGVAPQRARSRRVLRTEQAARKRPRRIANMATRDHRDERKISRISVLRIFW